MKLTSFLLMISVVSVMAGKTYSQTKLLNLNIKNATVKEVLSKIEDQSEFYFMYSGKVIDVNREVSVDVKNQKIEEVLKSLFAGTDVDYTIKDRIIVLTTPDVLNKEILADFQQQNVSGTVTDKSGQPLPGVTVVVQGTTQGTVTSADGDFTLSNTPEDATLVFSFVGMRTQEVVVGDQTTINLTMVEETIGLDEVVAVGYGVQKKVSLTGAITAVENEQITSAPVINVSNAIAGLLPGVIALNRTGRPGQNTSEILIRGRNTTGNNSPLVLVDGVGYSNWQDINTEDIESMSVLKDASAAIYGAQAANGVILITTKRGKTGKPTVKLALNQGISQLTRVPENAGSVLYAEFVNQRAEKDGRPLFYSEEDIRKYKDGTDPFYPSTDWYAESLNKFVSLSKHNMTIDGGTEAVQYLVSGSYSRENGIFKEASTYFKTYSLISRLDAQINPLIKFGLDLNYRYRDNYDEGDAFSDLAVALPTDPVYWPNGMPSSGIEHGANPVMMATAASGYDQSISKLFSLKGSFDIKIPYINGLGVDGYVSITNNGSYTENWDEPWITNSYNRNTQKYSEVPSRFNDPQLRNGMFQSKGYLVNLRAKYEMDFDIHHINAFIAAEQSESESNSFNAFRRYFMSTSIKELFAGSLDGMTNDGSASESGRQNIFGRVSYNFDDRYLFDFNFRYDGSYRFPKENRWGFFPGGSAAWRISEENFIKENYGDFIDNLKIRVSYGQLGNDAVPDFQFLSLYKLGQTGPNLGNPTSTYQGLTAGVSPNRNITWEVAEISNLGLDAIMWNGLFGVTLDLFKQKRSNILTTRDLAIPKFIGLDLPNENIGIVENKGFELELSHTKSSTNFSYSISGNFAFQRSKVIDIDEAENIPDYQKLEGHPVGSEAYYVAKGIFRTQEEIDNTAHVPGTVPGDLIYEDYNNDDKISSGDMKVLDKSPYPEITFGTNLSMTYRQFNIWANFAGQTRAWAYFHKHSKGAGNNILKELAENRYTPGSMDSKYPNIPDSEVMGTDISGYKSTFWLKDASFIRLKTLQLSYTLPRDVLSKVNIGSMKVFINGSNLFTWDKIKWFDPEGTQIQGKFYPQTKIYNLGINLSF